MIRIAAVGDIHFDLTSAGRLRPHLDEAADDLDALLIAGDMTCLGTVAEARVLADELHGLDLPRIAVLGNHDCHADAEIGVTTALAGCGVEVLECQSTTIDVPDGRVAIVGAKGFGGGFTGASGSEFGEREMKAFIRHTREASCRIQETLAAVSADVRIVLLHYAPVPDTVIGEKPEIFPFLGSHLLADAIDEVGADLILHGHAHHGTHEGTTPGGIPVRNVAQALLRRPFAVFDVAPGDVRRVDELDLTGSHSTT